MYDKSERPEKPHVPPPDLLKNVPPPSPPVDTPPPVPSGIEHVPRVKAAPVAVRIAPETKEEDETAEKIAPFNTRVIAAVIDCVVAFGLHLAVLVIFPSFMSKIGWLLAMAYMVTRDSLPFLGGQSVGKKAMKLKAVTLDGQSLAGNWEKSLIRSGVLAIPVFPLIELFVLLSREDKKGQGIRLGDEWAKTKVIVVKEPEEKVQE